jgi:hypothetical protein
VFAVTMSTVVFSDLQMLGQIGTTVGMGWPLRVRPRPASRILRPYGPRPAVRANSSKTRATPPRDPVQGREELHATRDISLMTRATVQTSQAPSKGGLTCVAGAGFEPA